MVIELVNWGILDVKIEEMGRWKFNVFMFYICYNRLVFILVRFLLKF